MRQNRSKKLAWVIVGLATLLSSYSVFMGLEGAAVAFWSVGIPAAIGLYINKQHVDLKYKKLTPTVEVGKDKNYN